MLILGINRVLKWVQVTTGGRSYTCPMKEVDGVLYFHFKKEWHKVMDFVSDHTTELVEEGGKIFSRRISK